MRLLKWSSQNGLSLTPDLADDQIPPYVILSHIWGDDGDELTFTDLEQGGGQGKAGYAKILFCAERAKKDKIKHFWVDTCCLTFNPDSYFEMQKAITSMYDWYHKAQKCYVYLSDVSTPQSNSDDDIKAGWESSLRASRWFTRGWTLRELLAPRVVEFFSSQGDFIGTKATLAQQIHEITTIPLSVLHGTPLAQIAITERSRWTMNRKTKVIEDQAYCLLGIFDVSIPFIYGERDNALRRLHRAINKKYGVNVAGASPHSDLQVGPIRGQSCLSIFDSGQPTSPRSSSPQTGPNSTKDDEEVNFWAGHSPRSADADVDIELVDANKSATNSNEDEATAEDGERDG